MSNASHPLSPSRKQHASGTNGGRPHIPSVDRPAFVRPIPVEHLQAILDDPQPRRIVRPAPPEVIIQAELADWELNALHRAGFRLTFGERMVRFFRRRSDLSTWFALSAVAFSVVCIALAGRVH